MSPSKRIPSGLGILLIFLFLLFAVVGCEKGTLGLKGGSVSGSVLDSRTLAGVSGVDITATNGTDENKSSKFTRTDSNGNYYINDMRAGEWSLSFDKSGYTPVDSGDTGSNSVKVVVVNNEHRAVKQVRMVQNYTDQYINIRGVLKDGRNGTLITYGNVQFIFGNTVFNNRLPSEFQTGFAVPAQVGAMQLTIKVTGFDNYTATIDNAATDRDLGVILLSPQTYKIVGVWKDVPGWVFLANPAATIVAYAGNRVIATASGQLNAQSFEMSGIPMGTSVSIEATIKGYRMNGPIPVVPNSDFQGIIYQTLSLKTNFAPIMRDVRLVVTGVNIRNNERVGGYCNETGTVWATTISTGGGIGGLGAPRVIDLGTNQVPTGYTLTFTGYDVEDGSVGTAQVLVNDDGTDAQIVTIIGL